MARRWKERTAGTGRLARNLPATARQSSCNYNIGYSALPSTQSSLSYISFRDRNKDYPFWEGFFSITTSKLRSSFLFLPGTHQHDTFVPLDKMELTQDEEDNERLVVIYNGSRLFSRSDIVELLNADIGRDDPDYPFKSLLESMNVKVDQQGCTLPCDTQAGGQEWDLDAVDRVIDELRRQPRTGADEVLISVQRGEEAKKSLVRSMVPSSFTHHADGFWQNEEDLSNGDILTEDYLPRVGFDQTREKFGATHPQNLADGPAIVAELAANYEPPIPVRQAETTPTILAPCSVVPAEPFASPFDALSPALQSIIFEGTQGKYYEQNPLFDGLGTSDSGSGADSKSSDSGEGGSCTEGG